METQMNNESKKTYYAMRDLLFQQLGKHIENPNTQRNLNSFFEFLEGSLIENQED